MLGFSEVRDIIGQPLMIGVMWTIFLTIVGAAIYYYSELFRWVFSYIWRERVIYKADGIFSVLLMFAVLIIITVIGADDWLFNKWMTAIDPAPDDERFWGYSFALATIVVDTVLVLVFMRILSKRRE